MHKQFSPSPQLTEANYFDWPVLPDALKSTVERRTGNTPHGVLCYRVRAINDQDESAFSNIARTQH